MSTTPSPEMPQESTAPAPPPPSDPTLLPDISPKGATARGTLEMFRALASNPQVNSALLKQIVDAETARDLFDQDYRTARIFALSGKFDDIKGSTAEQAIAQAMAKIRIGREWGMNDSDSIAFIFFTNGRPAVMTEIIATKIQQAGYGWDIDFHEEPETYKGKPYQRCVGCTLWLKQENRRENRWESVVDRKGNPVSVSFLEADAEHALIWEKGKQIPLSEKWNFKAWGRDMYFWRAMSRLRKYYLTGVMRGAIQFETRDEINLPPAEPVVLPAAIEATPDAEAQQPPRLRDVIMGQPGPTGQSSLLDDQEKP